MEHLGALEELGGMYVKTEAVSGDDSNDTTMDYVYSDSIFNKTPTFNTYGRGWLLKADSKYTYGRFGKYFEGGFWMPAQNGWFFRTADKQALLNKY
jgi:hypothetical protein